MDTIDTIIANLTRIATHRKPRFDFTSLGRQYPRKGFRWELGQGSGRTRNPQSYRADIAECLADAGNLLYLYPGHYDLAVIDVDSATSEGLRDFIPPLWHSPSRSGATRGGHLWYRRPRFPGDIKPLKPRTVHFEHVLYTFDVLYTQLIRVPMASIASVLASIADYLESPILPLSFPYEFLGLACVPGERDSKWWHYILAQTEQLGDPSLVSLDRWTRVAEATGYISDHSYEAFHTTFEQACAKADLGLALPAVTYAEIGAREIFEAIPCQYRYNIRSGQTEISWEPDTWESMGHELPRRRFLDYIRIHYHEARGRGSPRQWEPLRQWAMFIEWLDTYSTKQAIHDPIAAHLDSWAKQDPLSDTDSLLLALFAPADDTALMRAQIRNVELNLLLTLYLRLHTGRHTGAPAAIHFPYLPTFVGPPGCGKSRFCQSLGLGQYHTNDISFDDPPKEFGEKAQIAVVAEMEELKEMLGRRGSPRRGSAKKYIAQTKFDYRAAYARGKASTHHLMGVLLGTSNQPVDVVPSDGLWRRIVHLPVQRHPHFTGNLDEWDSIFAQQFPRAMARAIRHAEAGKTPRIDELRVVEALHLRIAQLEVDGLKWIERSVDGMEFD